MQLSNTFTVSLPVEETWKVFLDLERIAPCLPGAAITDVQDGAYHGGVKIKVGPISAQYRGVATFIDTNDAEHRAVILAKGKDVGGQGNANAQITATLTPYGEGTQVQVDTDLDLSGRVAQFGRGVIGDVTNKLLTQFSKNLEAEINAGSLARTGREPSRPRPSLDDIEPLDVMSDMGGLVARYALPALGGLVALTLGSVILARLSRAADWAGAGRMAIPQGSPVNVFLTVRDARALLGVDQILPGGAA